MKLLHCIAASALLVSACAPPSADPTAELASLRRAALAYQDAATAKDVDAVVALYDGNALMIPPNGELVEGLDAVRSYRFGFIETPGVELEFEIQRVEVSSSGDMGWTFSIGQITINQGDEPPGRDIVRDFHTWKKQSDGSWKVVVDMWNSGLLADG